jgi:CHAT domain-containing protein
MITTPWMIAVVDEWAPIGGLDTSAPELSGGLPELVVSLSRGQTGAAMRAAKEELERARLARDGSRGLLALGLGWLAEVRHFNLLPGGGGLKLMDGDTHWNGVEQARQMIAKETEVRSWPKAGDARVAWRWLQFAASRPTAAATVRDARGTPFSSQVTQLHTHQCELARDDARAISLSAQGFVERAIADMWWRAGEPERARQQLRNAIAVYEAGNDPAGIAAGHAVECEWAIAPWSSTLVRNLEINEAAYPTSELSWLIEQREGGPPSLDGAAEARKHIARTRKLAENASARRVLGSLSLSQGYLARVHGDHARQLAHGEKALAVFRAEGDEMHAQLARTHRLLAQIDAGTTPEDREEAAAIGRWGATEGSFSYALGLGLMMTRAARQALLREGDYERAEAGLQLALALNRALDADFRVAQTLADLGALSRTLGDRARARSMQGEALDALAVVAQQPAGAGEAAGRLALLTQAVYSEALDHRDAEGMQAAIDRLMKLVSLGDGVVGAAIGTFVSSTRDQSAVLIPLYRAVDARNRGEIPTAERHFDAAYAAAQNTPGVERDMMSAIVLATRRHFAEATQAYDRYIAAGGPRSGPAGQIMATMQMMGGERAAQELAKAAAREAEQSFSFMVRTRAYGRAASYLKELERLAGDGWYRDDPRPWRALSDVGEMLEGLGRFEEALKRYSAAIDALEKRRSLLSRDDLKTALSADFGAQYLYFQAARTALRLALASDAIAARRAASEIAFTVSEKGRARALLDLMATNLRIPDEQESTALRNWRECATRAEVSRGLLARARAANDQSRIAELEKRAHESDEAVLSASRTLTQERPELAQIVGDEAPTLSVEEVMVLLPDGGAMIQYMTLGDELLMWAVTQKGIKDPSIVELHATDLARRVRDFHSACAKGAPIDVVVAQSDALSELLLNPLQPIVNAHERLIVVPYGELHRLPFGALRWRGKWLAEHKKVTQLPSASVLGALTSTCHKGQDAAGPRAVLAVGSPDKMAYRTLDGEVRPLGALPGARDEVRYIARVLGGTALIGADATKRAVLDALPTHSLFHFATHGILFEEAPLLSGVALANAEVLTVHELLASRFRADLVTLSACDTGTGVLTGGQEIIGLSRGLLAAGARRVIVSLWPVADGATAVLMSRFADALKRGENAVDALCSAQAAVRALDAVGLADSRESMRDVEPDVEPRVEPRAGDHPQRWAPFVLVGS